MARPAAHSGNADPRRRRGGPHVRRRPEARIRRAEAEPFVQAGFAPGRAVRRQPRGDRLYGWIERQQQYLVCGTAKAVEQAYALGHQQDRVLRTSGMILNPRFYELPEIDRAAAALKG